MSPGFKTSRPACPLAGLPWKKQRKGSSQFWVRTCLSEGVGAGMKASGEVLSLGNGESECPLPHARLMPDRDATLFLSQRRKLGRGSEH